MVEVRTASRPPPLNALRAFEATARAGSVSAAARELKVTHGAVSHQIRGLEETLGVALFERSGNRLRLTAQGALLAPPLRAAFGDIAAATQLMRRPEASGTLRLASVAGFLSFWLLPRLEGFTRQYPAITLSVATSNDPAALADRDIDVAVLYGRPALLSAWIRPLSPLRLFPVVSPSLMNSNPLRSVRDLARHTLLHADEGAEWTTWLTAADTTVPPDTRRHFLGDARLTTEAALLGQGVALGDNLTSANLIARGELIAPFDLSAPVHDAFYVACRRDMRSAPIVAAFVDWLIATIEADPLPAQQSPRIAQRTLAQRAPRSGKRASAGNLRSSP